MSFTDDIIKQRIARAVARGHRSEISRCAAIAINKLSKESKLKRKPTPPPPKLGKEAAPKPHLPDAKGLVAHNQEKKELWHKCTNQLELMRVRNMTVADQLRHVQATFEEYPVLKYLFSELSFISYPPENANGSEEETK